MYAEKKAQDISNEDKPNDKQDKVQHSQTKDTTQCRLSKNELIQKGEGSETNTASSPNRTGMPDRLNSRLEKLSGYDLSSVRVRYNSSKPKQLGALAYTQGTDIHIGPGQKKDLPHEGWHAVQQMQGRVKPTKKINGMGLNDNINLEKEADIMGARAWKMPEKLVKLQVLANSNIAPTPIFENSIQRYPIELDKLNDNNNNPGVFTDTRYNWMRMRESDLGETTFELLNLNGTPSGSLMIWEQNYDQYRFSPDGRSFDDTMFPPHFMEEITGDSRIADQEDEDLIQKGIGEYGVGFRPAMGRTATLETFGLISCVAFALVGESAGFLCHMLVGTTPDNEGTLKTQVNALVSKFKAQSGENDLYCQLVLDFFQYGGEPDWLKWIKPDGIHTETINNTKHQLIVKGYQEGPSLMWRGNPLRY